MSIKNIVIKSVDALPFALRSRIKNIPGAKQLQSYLLKKYVSKKDFIATISGGPAKGLVFPVQMPQDKLMWIGTWELEFACTLHRYVQPGWVCYDIGGYKGYYAGIMALKGAQKVYVFEPMPANAEKIQQLISLNPTLPISLEKYAVSDTNGNATFKIMPEETMGKLHASSFEPNQQESTIIEVDCITIDRLIEKNFPAPDFIKIDVEGAEEFVLRGASKLFAAKKPILMIEVHSLEIGARCVALLKDHYNSIRVFETGLPPGNGEAAICHYIINNV